MPTGQFSRQPVYRPSFARNEQFDKLKQIADDQNNGKILNSSPEIHKIGTRNPANSHFMRRAQSNTRGFPNNRAANNYSDEKVRAYLLLSP